MDKTEALLKLLNEIPGFLKAFPRSITSDPLILSAIITRCDPYEAQVLLRLCV